MTAKRTEAASKARHLNALRRKAPVMVKALRELGYEVTEPKCGQHYQSELAGTALVCVLRRGHEGDHSWYEFEDDTEE